MVGDILQPSHLLFILVIALLVLGPKRLPEVGKSLGRGLRDFRSALRETDPREDLAQLNQQTMAPIQTAAQPVPEPMTQVAPAPEPMTQVIPAPEPVATGAPRAQAPAPEQYESD
jgi:sec-independent protein translocase protein TatA